MGGDPPQWLYHRGRALQAAGLLDRRAWLQGGARLPTPFGVVRPPPQGEVYVAQEGTIVVVPPHAEWSTLDTKRVWTPSS